MDAFYEESALDKNAEKGAKKYKIANVFFWIFVVLAVFCALGFLFNVPFGVGEGEKAEEAYQFQMSLAVFSIIQGVMFGLFAFLLYRLKARFNVSYDYCFVSGELRISKVFNINRRKLLARIDTADILQIGDTDNSGFDRLYSDPNTKKVVCTTNDEAQEGKFLMYILTGGDNGKMLYILECRELLLMNILKFTRRGVLESDYVMQEKKQK